MRKNIFTSVLTLSLGAIVSVSCSSKLGNLTADNFKVTPTPLELQGTQVPVTVYGTFPEKFMKKKAVVTRMATLEGSGIRNVARYRTRTIPAAGSLLKPEDEGHEQITLEL